MRYLYLSLVSVLSLGLSSGAAYGFGGMIAIGMNEAAEIEAVETPFRAEARIETEDQEIDTVIYYEPGHVRDEMQMGGNAMVFLQDLEARKHYMLMPQGMYMEFDSGQSNEQIQEYKLIERTVVGKEEVNGFDTTKYKVIYEGPNGKYGGFSWFTDDNIAVKAFIVSEQSGRKERVRFQITKLERGDQPDSLFVIPSNYRKFDLGSMGGMGSMMNGGMGGQSGRGSEEWPPQGEVEEKPLTEELADSAQEGAEEAAKQETEQSAKENVSKGLRKLFGRD